MKKLIVIAAILGVLFSVGALICVAAPLLNSNRQLTGSGKLVTTTVAVPDFHEVDASRGVKVVIVEKADKITIEADDNVIDWVTVTASEGELRVGIDKKIQSVSNVNVTVTVPSNGKIRSLDTSSGAKITTAVGLTASEFKMDASSGSSIQAAVKATKCEIDASSAGKVEAAIAVKECDIDASSAAKITLSGSAGKCEADLSSASKLSAQKFVVEEYVINASSSSKASINCTRNLRASASSAAKIDYTGDCSADISRSSAGKVSKE